MSVLEPYGLVDVAIRASTNADGNGNTYFGFSQGLFNGSRWGFRGTEDIGGSVKAIYTLEGGVIVPVGQLDQQGQVFGRQAWVGLKTDYGTLTFGRSMEPSVTPLAPVTCSAQVTATWVTGAVASLEAAITLRTTP